MISKLQLRVLDHPVMVNMEKSAEKKKLGMTTSEIAPITAVEKTPYTIQS